VGIVFNFHSAAPEVVGELVELEDDVDPLPFEVEV
jgi:hypothetical protein